MFRNLCYSCGMSFHIITLLPKIIEEYANSSILGRARRNKKIKIFSYDLRKWGIGKHKKVDGKPFGGGPGMVLAVEPIYKAVRSVQKKIRGKNKKTRVILFSTRGKLFSEKEAKRLSGYSDLILICGRYEGVDERVAKHIADEEISMGEFVLTGGEIPALAVLDAVSRFIPGVLGKEESREDIKGSHPAYTRPEEFVSSRITKGKTAWRVPKDLLSGDHKKIADWRAGK